MVVSWLEENTLEETWVVKVRIERFIFAGHQPVMRKVNVKLLYVIRQAYFQWAACVLLKNI